MRDDCHLFEEMPEWNVFKWMAGLLSPGRGAPGWSLQCGRGSPGMEEANSHICSGRIGSPGGC
jgi:hypothetical protein